MLHPRIGRRSCALATVLLVTCALPHADAQLFRRRGLVRGQPLRNILRVATWPVRAVGREVFVNGPARRSARRLRGQGLFAPFPGDRWRAARGGYATGGYSRGGGRVVYSNGSSGYARGREVAPGVRQESGSSIAQALRNHEHPERWARIHTVGPDGKPQAFWTYTHPSGTRQWYDPYSRDPETGAPGSWRTEDPHGLTRGFFPTSTEDETPSEGSASTTSADDGGTGETPADDPDPAPRPSEGLRTTDGAGEGDAQEPPTSGSTEPAAGDSPADDGKDPGAGPDDPDSGPSDGGSLPPLYQEGPAYADAGDPFSSGATGDGFSTGSTSPAPASQDLFADAGAGAWDTTGTAFDTAYLGSTGGWDMPASAGAGSWDAAGSADGFGYGDGLATLGGGADPFGGSSMGGGSSTFDSPGMGGDAFASYDSPSMGGGSLSSMGSGSSAGAADPFS